MKRNIVNIPNHHEIPCHPRLHRRYRLRLLRHLRRVSARRDLTLTLKQHTQFEIAQMRTIQIPGMAEACRLATRLTVLPMGLRYDGIMSLGANHLVQLTEHDKTVASYGATFYCQMAGITLEKIAERREEKRVEFAQGAKLAA